MWHFQQTDKIFLIDEEKLGRKLRDWVISEHENAHLKLIIESFYRSEMFLSKAQAFVWAGELCEWKEQFDLTSEPDTVFILVQLQLVKTCL